MPVWDGSEWHQWFPKGDGTLIKGKVIDVVKSCYIGKEAASPSDLWVPFVELMWQRASWPKVTPLISAIGEDFSNLGTSISKLKHFFQTREMAIDSVSAFVETELEYLVILARTIFDLLQESLAIMWNEHTQLLEPESEALRKRNKLPETFSKMTMRDKKDIKTPEEIIQKYAIPPALAEVLIKHAPFFVYLRAIRDKIVHGGSNVSSIFVTEKGFCVSQRDGAFGELPIWNEAHRYNENLVSLLPWLSYIVLHTVEACSEIMAVFSTQIRLPQEVAPEYHVFVRDPNNKAFIDLLKVQRGELVWWN